MLLLLPPYYGSKPLSAHDASQLLLLERQLLQKSTAVPVFFTRETPELTAAVSPALDICIAAACLQRCQRILG